MLKDSASAPQVAVTRAPLSMAEQVQRAEEHGWQTAYESHRARIHARLDAPVMARRGRGDCLALVLLPIALLLVAVHPLVAIPVLLGVGSLYLAGSRRLQQERDLIAAADAEALRLWLEAGHPRPASLDAAARAISSQQQGFPRRNRA